MLGDLEGGLKGGDGATMPSPLQHPFRAALWVGVRRRDVRFGVSFAAFAIVTALVAIGLIVGRWRRAVDAAARVRSEMSPLLPR